MKVLLHKNFKKDYKKLPRQTQTIFKERIAIFLKDPFEPLLNNHALLGKYAGYRSINIGGDYRVLYKLLSKDVVVFVTIGTHSKLYKNS